MGLPAYLAGVALAIALGVDAISDPLVGRWSDRHQSVLGRRHPFLYAAILPASLFFYLIWAPPFELTSQSHLFVYLLVMIIALRLSMTFFFVPMYAMVPELTTDYDERTALVSWRISSNYFIGGLMSIAMYGIWLADTPEYPDGILRADGYVEAGIVGGALILVGMLFAAAGTHREIPRLRKTPKKKTQSARGLLAEYWETLADKSILALVLYSIISSVANGSAEALWVYVQNYYWEFTSEQIAWMVSAQLLAPLFAFVLTPVFSNRRDKKTVLIWSTVASVVGYGWPLLLRSLGLFMSNDNPLLFPLMLVNAAVITIFDIIVYTVGYSMMADVVEARQLETGRREEGLLSSFQLFAQKAFSGMGILVGGFFLELITFPTQVESADVPAETVFDLGLVYGPVFMVIYLASLAPLVFYRINRKTHLENLAKLSE